MKRRLKGWSVGAQFRQGDVLLIRCESEPKGSGKILEAGNRIVLALGEATGHAHAVHGMDAALFAGSNGSRILNLATEATLKHEEHAAIELEKGTYEVRLQRTWSMLEDERERSVRFVLD